jgi:hypothetical protein
MTGAEYYAALDALLEREIEIKARIKVESFGRALRGEVQRNLKRALADLAAAQEAADACVPKQRFDGR